MNVNYVAELIANILLIIELHGSSFNFLHFERNHNSFAFHCAVFIAILVSIGEREHKSITLASGRNRNSITARYTGSSYRSSGTTDRNVISNAS